MAFLKNLLKFSCLRGQRDDEEEDDKPRKNFKLEKDDDLEIKVKPKLVHKRNPKAEKNLSSFVGNKGKTPNIKKEGAMMREGVCSLSPAVAKKFQIADEICQKLYKHPVKIEPAPKSMSSPISYKDGVIYLNETCDRAKLVGGIIFELNNAVKAQAFKDIEDDWESEAILKKDAEDYGITDKGAAKMFDELETAEERRAMAQEYVEWEHMMNGTIAEQEEVARELGLDGEDAKQANYINTDSKGRATDGSWDSFEDYFKDQGKGHYDIVLNALKHAKKESPEKIARDILATLRGKVPEEKMALTIKTLLAHAEKKKKMDEFHLFVPGEARLFSEGEFMLNKRDFNEEAWKKWVKS